MNENNHTVRIVIVTWEKGSWAQVEETETVHDEPPVLPRPHWRAWLYNTIRRLAP